MTLIWYVKTTSHMYIESDHVPTADVLADPNTITNVP
jgi:hypothetical protein